jgi:hypothetical protein
MPYLLRMSVSNGSVLCASKTKDMYPKYYNIFYGEFFFLHTDQLKLYVTPLPYID